MDCSSRSGLRGIENDVSRYWIKIGHGLHTLFGTWPLWFEAASLVGSFPGHRNEVAWKEHASFQCHEDSQCSLHHRPLLCCRRASSKYWSQYQEACSIEGKEISARYRNAARNVQNSTDRYFDLGYTYGHSLGRTKVSEDHKQPYTAQLVPRQHCKSSRINRP